MRRIILICLLLCACNAAASRRAVLVGINHYSAPNWPNLSGAVNDVEAMREMLVLRYGFETRDIIALTDGRATRAAILQSLEQHLARPATKDDVLLFYFAGHGSQRRNSLSDEHDQLDETLVPADARLGVDAIRDKELRPIFNRILDRGARLTIILDNCHSGSGARVPGGAGLRGVDADLRDIADGTRYGPRPEERGALVLAATQDSDSAWETMGEDKKMHGAFSWAWIRAMRDSSPDESAVETFSRAAARMRAERPYQRPVIAGIADVLHRPFLGSRHSRGERDVIAVEKVSADGTVLLQGGWAHGLAVGTELRTMDDSNTTVRVTRLLGLGRSEARGFSVASSIRSGALMEIVSWTAPSGRPLRIWMPPSSEILDVQNEGIERVRRAEDADYILVRRYKTSKLEYAWRRRSSCRKSALPCETAWVDSAAALRDVLVRLRRIHAWHILESPRSSQFAYRLGVRRERDGQWAKDVVTGNEKYALYLRASKPALKIEPRYVYVFAIDSHGGSSLLFGTSSVENRFPRPGDPSKDIPLGPNATFRIAPPYGIDTYVLLTTAEPLANPRMLEWDGVRGRRPSMPSIWSIERIHLESIPR